MDGSQHTDIYQRKMSTTLSQRSSSSLLRMVAVHGLLLLALTLSRSGVLGLTEEVTQEEMQEKMAYLFPSIDVDHDGYVSLKELQQWYTVHATKRLVSAAQIDISLTPCRKHSCFNSLKAQCFQPSSHWFQTPTCTPTWWIT